MEYPKIIHNLINKFSQLPTVGPKTAERYVFYLLKQPQSTLQEFGEELKKLQTDTIFCEKCHAISEASPCQVCQDTHRDASSLCIVSNTQDLVNIESTQEFTGKYFVLNGLINTVEQVEPKDLNIDKLMKLIQDRQVQEIILALSPTIEGETTALYLQKLLKDKHIKVSTLAKGLSSGSNLEYTDQNTLANAFKNRI